MSRRTTQKHTPHPSDRRSGQAVGEHRASALCASACKCKTLFPFRDIMRSRTWWSWSKQKAFEGKTAGVCADTHMQRQREKLYFRCRKRLIGCILLFHQANLNIPMGGLRPGAGHPVKRREETADTEEVRRHRNTDRRHYQI